MMGQLHQEHIIIENIYTSNIIAPNHIKEILRELKGEIGSKRVIVGNFSTSLSTMDRLSRQKINQ